MSADSKKIVLWFPTPIDEWDHRFELPLSIMAIAAPLELKGYQMVLIDERLTDDPYEALVRECADALCLGVSSMTGFQLVGAVKGARLIKEKFPELPIVWGGYHASLRPEETVQSSFVDLVVRGQGEITFEEVIDCLENGKDFADVLGVVYMDDGKVVANEERPVEDINIFPAMPYHLVDVAKLIRHNQTRFKETFKAIEYHSSQGCPHRCAYCADAKIYKRKWRGLDGARVVSEIKHLLDEYGANQINFTDANFFVNESRVEEICRGFLDNNMKIKWVASTRADHFVRYKPETLELVRDAGCLRIIIGAESGNQKVLDMVNKDASVDATLQSARICAKLGIKVSYDFIIGFPYPPGEELDDAQDTMQLIRQIKEVHPNVMTKVFYYTPFPGTPLYDVAVRYGLTEPKSLEEWSVYNPVNMKTIWITDKQKDWARMTNGFYIALAYPTVGLLKMGEKNALRRPFFKILTALARYRVKNSFYMLPLGWWGFKLFKRLSKFPRYLNEIS